MDNYIDWAVSGNKRRIFISVAFGCVHKCKYCYLNDIKSNEEIYKFNEKQILDEIYRRGIYVSGKNGSIITIGCFTECMDNLNKRVTINLIKYFACKGNYVQLSTKKKICDEDILEISKCIQYDDQINIFISMPTISKSTELEPNIDTPKLRLENLNYNKYYGICTYLYIKPVLLNITILDIEKYVEIIKKYKTDLIIGDKLIPSDHEETKNLLLGKSEMKEQLCEDTDYIAKVLSRYTKIFRHSDEVIERK